MVGLQGSGKTTSVRQAGSPPREGPRQEGVPGRGRRLPPGRRRSAQDPRRQARPPGVLDPGRRPGHDLQATPIEFAAKQGCDTIIFDTAGRLAIDEPLMQELEDIDKARPAGQHLPGPRLDDRPGRGQRRRHVQQAVEPRRRDHDQARRRRPRRRRAVGQGDHRQADQVPRHGRVPRQARGVPARGVGVAHPRHGRHRRPGQGLRAGGGRGEGRRRRDAHVQGQVRHAGLPRADPHDPEDGVAEGPVRQAAVLRRLRCPRASTSTTRSW
jgi:hypothetical protein